MPLPTGTLRIVQGAVIPSAAMPDEHDISHTETPREPNAPVSSSSPLSYSQRLKQKKNSPIRRTEYASRMIDASTAQSGTPETWKSEDESRPSIKSALTGDQSAYTFPDGLPLSFCPPGLNLPSLSPRRSRHFYQVPSSPSSGSQLPARSHSPASSQIFERDVQENIAPSQPSPSIPSHIITENHIPPVLEASSAAITNQRLDPDEVEIITHTIHQPAIAAVANTICSDQFIQSSIPEEPGMHSEDLHETSTYGATGATDIRRLSFISFADVLNAEHAEGTELASNRDSLQTPPLSHNPTVSTVPNRSPSSLLSSPSSQGLETSPPTSIPIPCKVQEASPNWTERSAGSPLLIAHSPVSANFGNELSVETMRQALRRTESGDLSALRCQTSSGNGNDVDH